MQEKYILGIDAGGTKVAYGLFKSGGELVDRHQHSTDITADGPAFCDGMILAIKSVLVKNNLQLSQLQGIGVCMPSFILFDKGYICITSAMINIKDFAMQAYMQQRLDVPIVLDNDSNVAALAEHRHGAGMDSNHMVYMATSTGVGSGIIINKELFRGAYGWAGESGHMIATPDEGMMCGCQNRGCFMSYASGRYAPKFAQKQISEGVSSSLAEYEAINCKHILAAYHAGDELAIKTVERMGYYLAYCVFNVYQLLNINIFVFGGGLVNFGQALFVKVKQKFDELNHIPQHVEFRFARLKKDFGIVGAAELIAPIKYTPPAYGQVD